MFFNFNTLNINFRPDICSKWMNKCLGIAFASLRRHKLAPPGSPEYDCHVPHVDYQSPQRFGTIGLGG